MDPLTAFISGQRGALDVQQQRENLAQSQMQGQQLGLQGQQQQMQFGLQKAQLLGNAIDAVAKLDQRQRMGVVNQLRPELQRFGIALPQMTEDQLTDQALQGYKASVAGFIQNPQLQGITGQERMRQMNLQSLEGAMDEQGNLKPEKQLTAMQRAAAIDLGLIAKAGMTAAERAALDFQLGQAIADQKGREAAAAETGKLGAKIELEPSLVKAKAEVEALVEKQISQQGQMRKLEDAQSLYNNLSNANLDKIYGRGESVYPEMLRSQEGIDLLAQRNQLVAMLKLGSAGELKGQGPVTDSERKMLAEAATLLENPNISPSLAKAALDDAMRVLSRGAGQQFTPPQTQNGASAQPATQQQKTFTSSTGIQFTVE